MHKIYNFSQFVLFFYSTGNGPSGITLSYMLSGHWPYWIPGRVANHPDELLRARLNFADSTKSLVEQDLINLADGLEGRSTNPVSLLVREKNINPICRMEYVKLLKSLVMAEVNFLIQLGLIDL